MAIGNVTVEEGSTAIFNVTVGAAAAPYTVTFGTSLAGQNAESADFNTTLVVKIGGTSVAPNLDGSYTIPAGTTTLTVEVVTNDDNAYEGAESFLLTGRTQFMGSDTSGTGTIKDDGTATNGDDVTDTGPNLDPGASDNDLPSLTITGKDNVSEGSPAVFDVHLSGAYSAAQSITLSLGNMSTTTGDYSGTLVVTYVDPTTHATITVNVANGGNFTMPAGLTDFKVRVDTTVDSGYEGPEIFSLTAAITGGPSGSDTATILDDSSGVVYDETGNPTAGAPDDDRPAPPPPAPPPTPVPQPAPVLMQPADSGFGIPLVPVFNEPLAEPVKELPSLTVVNQVPEQYTDSGAKSSFSLPADTFSHSDPTEVLQLSATQANGQKLPRWIRFDANSATFQFEAPADFVGELKLKVIARDSKGNEVSTIFRFNIGKKREATKLPAGRASLSDQLRLVGRDAGFSLPQSDARMLTRTDFKKVANA